VRYTEGKLGIIGLLKIGRNPLIFIKYNDFFLFNIASEEYF